MLEIVGEIESLLRQGYTPESIKKKVKGFSEELLSIAKARIKNCKGHKVPDEFIFDEEDLRFCTNQLIAKYRAERLKCDVIVDVGCGIGIQAIEFAKCCKKVIAIDTDKKRIGYAKLNAEIAKVSNITFVDDDALSAIKGISADIIFWDPERPASEKERNLDSLKPCFDAFMAEARKVTGRIVVELPPQIDVSKIKDNCEREYVSVEKLLNRLNIYFGPLKKCDVSAVSLPVGSRLEYDGKETTKIKPSGVRKFIYEIDSSVQKAGLIDLLASSLRGTYLFRAGKKEYLTSERPLDSAFLKAYGVLSIETENTLKDFLSRRCFGKTILHGNIDERKYASMRKGIEKGLLGDKTAHLFFAEGIIIVAEKA